jgi:hypothetical protein
VFSAIVDKGEKCYNITMIYPFPLFDPALPLKDRVRDLVSRLSLEEKAGFIPNSHTALGRLGIAAWSFGA